MEVPWSALVVPPMQTLGPKLTPDEMTSSQLDAIELLQQLFFWSGVGRCLLLRVSYDSRWSCLGGHSLFPQVPIILPGGRREFHFPTPLHSPPPLNYTLPWEGWRVSLWGLLHPSWANTMHSLAREGRGWNVKTPPPFTSKTPCQQPWERERAKPPLQPRSNGTFQAIIWCSWLRSPHLGAETWQQMQGFFKLVSATASHDHSYIKSFLLSS